MPGETPAALTQDVPSNRLTHDWARTIQVQRVRVHERTKDDDADAHYYHKGRKQVKRHTQLFCTESRYRGKWDALGFAGFGVYAYPHGPIYKGYFKDGQFNGDGDIYYPMGHHIQGKWKKGKLMSYRYYFADGLEYREPWRYCDMPDRRFQVERNHGFRTAGDEYITNTQPTPEIPEGCYDTGDGYFDPKTNAVYFYLKETREGSTTITSLSKGRRSTKDGFLHGEHLETQHVGRKMKRLPGPEEIKFIKYKCRSNSDVPAGYCKEFYEFWISGRANEVQAYNNLFPVPNSELDFFLHNGSVVPEDNGSAYSFEFF